MSFLKPEKVVLIFAWILLSNAVLAQKTSEVRLIDWIQEIEKTYDVGFSYNHSLLDELRIEQPTSCTDLATCLQNLAAIAPLNFEVSGTNQYLILPIRKQAIFSIIDSETNEFVDVLRIAVNRQQAFFLLPENNQYSIPDLFPTDSISIHSRFYSTMSIQASEILGQTASLRMAPDTIYLEEVIIEDYLASGVDSKLSDHSMQVNMKGLGLLSGETDGDILNLLKTLPGIRTPDGKPGSLNFRGSTFDQTLIFFDDIPIYHSGHFFGTISPYNPAAVSSIGVYRGTLPAKWGGRVGGLIDLHTLNVVADSAQYGVAVNTIYSGVNMQAPIVKNKLGVLLAARSNYPIDYLFPKLDEFRTLNFQGSQIDPSFVGNDNTVEAFNIGFHDVNGKLIYQVNDNHQASFSFMNIQNDFSYSFDSKVINTIENQTSNLDNWGMTAKWNGEFSEKTSTKTSITNSSLRIFELNTRAVNRMLSETDEVSNTIDDFRIQSELSHQLDQKTTLDFGYQYVNHDVSLIEQREINDPRMARGTKANIHSFFGSIQRNWSERFISTLGIRSDWYSPLKTRYFDPRLTLSYMASENLYLKASAGSAHQFIKRQLPDDFDDFRLQNQFWTLANDQSPVLDGSQAMVGFLLDRSGWLFDVEFYTKKTNGIVQQVALERNEIGSLSTLGADFFIKRRWNKLESWISYSLSHTKTNFEEKTTAYFDQRHIFNWTALTRWTRWNLATTWSYLSGMPVVIPEVDPMDPNSNGQSNLEIAYTDNFPAQHQLDLSVTYKWLKKDDQYRGVIGLSLQNVYDQQNIINIFQNSPRVEQPYRYAIGFAPNITFSINF